MELIMTLSIENIISLITIFSGSAVLAAFVAGIFTIFKENLSFKFANLSQDKDILRKLFQDLSLILEMYDLSTITNNLENKTKVLEFLKIYYAKYQEILIYMDNHNPKSTDLRLLLFKTSGHLNEYLYLRQSIIDNQCYEYDNIGKANQRLHLLSINIFNLFSDTQKNISEYFCFYYPQPYKQIIKEWLNLIFKISIIFFLFAIITKSKYN